MTTMALARAHKQPLAHRSVALAARAFDEELGALIAGRFVFERVLGRGGCGLVVAATHVTLGHRVAIKLLLPTALENADALERFAREARLAACLRSDHVARVHDVGTLEDGTPFMVMEHLEGTDLQTRLTLREPLPLREAVTYVLQACEAIAEAHALGIVHRDLKPANLFLAERVDGTRGVKVLDFGISKIMPTCSIDQAGTTDPKLVLGTPGFMAPEQALSKNVDARCDVWALGAILYRALSGRLAFDAATTGEMYSAILLDDPAPLAVVDPNVPMALSNVVQHCLEKHPGKRFADVVSLADALVPFAPPEAKHHADRARALVRAARGEVPSVRERSMPPKRASTPAHVEAPRERMERVPNVHEMVTRRAAPLLLDHDPTPRDVPKNKLRWWLAIPVAAIVGGIAAIAAASDQTEGALAANADVATASERAFEVATLLASSSRVVRVEAEDPRSPPLVAPPSKSQTSTQARARDDGDEREFGRRK